MYSDALLLKHMWDHYAVILKNETYIRVLKLARAHALIVWRYHESSTVVVFP